MFTGLPVFQLVFLDLSGREVCSEVLFLGI
jgi:hypothetical protein